MRTVKIDRYTTKQWEWDEAKFQMKTPLREMSENISGRIASLDDELKMKLGEVNALKSILQVMFDGVIFFLDSHYFNSLQCHSMLPLAL